MKISTAEGDPATEVLAEHKCCDAGDVLMDKSDGRAQAASFTLFQKEWMVIDPAVRFPIVSPTTLNMEPGYTESCSWRLFANLGEGLYTLVAPFVALFKTLFQEPTA